MKEIYSSETDIKGGESKEISTNRKQAIPTHRKNNRQRFILYRYSGGSTRMSSIAALMRMKNKRFVYLIRNYMKIITFIFYKLTKLILSLKRKTT